MAASLVRDLQATAVQLSSLAVQRNRLDAARARADTRDWARERRERTRHLLELGGLVQQAGLVELLHDDRATLLGAFLELADRLHTQEDERQAEASQSVSRADLLARWQRRGLRAFDADAVPIQVREQRHEGGKTSP